MPNQSGEGFKGYISTYRILYREIIVHTDNIIIGGKGLGAHNNLEFTIAETVVGASETLVVGLINNPGEKDCADTCLA